MSKKRSTFAAEIKEMGAGWAPKSGRRDSNSRPPAPKAGILTGLNYYPNADDK